MVLLLLPLLTASIVASAQFDDTGAVGRVDDRDSSPPPGTIPGIPPGDEDTQEYPGLIGRVAERIPHPECDTCFTVPGLGEGRYQIFELMGDDDAEIIIPRMIPNPTPARVSESVTEVDEETGEAVWYIGDQAFVGPTDEDYWSDEAPLPTIALKRIQMRFMDDIMSIPGVHGFGIGPTGFVVDLRPEQALNSEKIPLSLDGVPVTVAIEDMATLKNHIEEPFRPIPMGAGFAVRIPTPSGGYITGGGTLGPHVVRDRPHVGGCCQLWTLTAAHIVKYRLTDAWSQSGSYNVYQPYERPPDPADHFASVAYAFQLTRCDTVNDPDCLRANAPINWTYVKPDIAAINHGFRTSPFNNPTGTDPTRRLQYSATDYHNGPSGRIKTASENHKHRIWGAVTPATRSGLVLEINKCKVIENDNTNWRYKVCGLNRVNLDTVKGDSGALVAYHGTGKRHVAGVFIAGNSWYVPAEDIKTAFNNVREGGQQTKAFSHFWGTKSDYQAPSTQTCDPPGC